MDTTTPAPWASIGPTWFQIALNAVPNFFKFSVGCEDSDRERLAITTCTESERDSSTNLALNIFELVFRPRALLPSNIHSAR